MKYIKKFENQEKEVKKVNETGEWTGGVDLEFVKNNPDADDEHSNWIKALYELVEEVEASAKDIDPSISFDILDVKGFDNYQGPYATVTIKGESGEGTHVFWTAEDHQMYIEDLDGEAENGSFVGDTFSAVNAIVNKYGTKIQENKKTNLKYIKIYESEEALSNDVSTELNRDMKKIWNYNKFTDHQQPRGIITPGRFVDLGEKKGYINRIEGDIVFLESIDGSNEMLEVSFADVAKSYKMKTPKEEIDTKIELKEGSGDVVNPIDAKPKTTKDDKTEKIQKKVQKVADKKLKNKLGGPNKKD